MLSFFSNPFLDAISRGREAVRRILGDRNAGFYGECYDFAFALKQVCGMGNYTVLKGGSTVYHVLLRVGDSLFDAAGVRSVDDYTKENKDMRVLDASDNEIEELVDKENADWIIMRLLQVVAGAPHFSSRGGGE